MTQRPNKPRDVTVRLARDADQADLDRLAALDSATPIDTEALVAETDSKLIAAVPLESGAPIADPFEATADEVALLELRRAQLEDAA
jgi:hypothetical protein